MAESTLAGSRPLYSSRALVRLIIPLVIEQLLMMTVGMADTVMVTACGEAVVSGVSLVDNVNTLMIQIFSALSTGGAVVVAQYLGHREEGSAQTAARQLLYAMCAVSLFLMAVALAFREHILYLIFGKVEQDVMESALSYFLITAMAYPFMGVYNAGAALFRAMGDSKVAMYSSLVINLINIGVNALLIYGYDMAAAGAAIGTLVSRIAAAAIILVLLRRPENTVQVRQVFPLRLRWDMIRRILGIGVPNGLENGMFQVGKLLVLNLITSFSTAAVAANAIANSIVGVVNVPGQSIGLGMITVIGRCMGAGEVDQADRYTRKLVGVCQICQMSLNLILFFVAENLVTIFNLGDAATAMASQVLQSYAVASLIWSLAFALPNSLRAAGDAVFTMGISLASMFACRVALSYVFACDWGLGWGLFGVWMAMFADWAVRALLFSLRYRQGRWRHIRVIG